MVASVFLFYSDSNINSNNNNSSNNNLHKNCELDHNNNMGVTALFAFRDYERECGEGKEVGGGYGWRLAGTQQD